MRYRRPATLVAWRSPIEPRHLGAGGRLIDENELGRIKRELTVKPGLARFLYVRALLFGGMRRLLWDGPLLPPEWIGCLGNRRKEAEMHVAVLGIDLGKNSCSVVGLDPTGRVVLRRRVHRDAVVKA